MDITFSYKIGQSPVKEIPENFSLLFNQLIENLNLTEQEQKEGAITFVDNRIDIDILKTDNKILFNLLKDIASFLQSQSSITNDVFTHFINSVNDEIFAIIYDFDHTITRIHTEGAPALEGKEIYYHFKNPEKTSAEMMKLHRIGHWQTIATDGVFIQFSVTDTNAANETKTSLHTLFLSGQQSIKEHFKLLFGEKVDQVINNIESYEAYGNESVTGVTINVSREEYDAFVKRLEETRKTLSSLCNELNATPNRANEILESIQAFQNLFSEDHRAMPCDETKRIVETGPITNDRNKLLHVRNTVNLINQKAQELKHMPSFTIQGEARKNRIIHADDKPTYVTGSIKEGYSAILVSPEDEGAFHDAISAKVIEIRKVEKLIANSSVAAGATQFGMFNPELNLSAGHVAHEPGFKLV